MKIAIAIVILVVIVGIIFAMLRNKRRGSKANADVWPPEVLAEINADRAKREQVRLQSPELFAAISVAMFRHDPMGINMETNTDEYESEAGTVIPRLPSCSSSVDVVTILHEEFSRWFGADTAGPPSKYQALAGDVWALWSERKTEPDGQGR